MSKEIRYRSKNFAVVADTFRSDSTGAISEIEFVSLPAIVIAIPLVSPETVMLVEQWRPLLDRTLIECPGGKVMPGEAIEDAIRRELSEEIGLVPSRLELLGDFFPSVGSSTERVYCFVASEMRRTDRSVLDVKRMSLREFSMEELRQELGRGILPDGKTYIALSAFLR